MTTRLARAVGALAVMAPGLPRGRFRRLAAVACMLVAATASPRAVRAQGDTMTTSFIVDGLRVILRRNPTNDVVAANVYLLGGTQQLSPATQGIEAFLLQASERGTARFPREAVRQLTAGLGSQVAIDPTPDWTRFGFTGVRDNFDSTWAIFADRLMAPTLDSSEVELVRARMISEFREAENSPDLLLSRLADSMAHAGQPYAFAPLGTEATLRSITLSALRRYEATQMVTSRMLLVVVGNIERPRLEQLVQRTLGRLPRGVYAWSPPPMPARAGRALVVRDLQLPTNYLLGFAAGPSVRDGDYHALRVAAAVLSGRFFTEIRSRRNLSYEVEAPFLDRAVADVGLYVTTTDPDATLAVMRTEITRLQRELIDPQGLERLIQQFITDYFLKNETNADQATFLARAQIYHGDYRAAETFVDDLRRVRPEDVRRVARRYLHDFRFVYLGKPSALSRARVDVF